MKSQKSKVKNRGFTLVEMIVSLGLFAVVATVSLGALVHIVSANKKAQTLQSAITNLNFALETMSREMRVGSDYRCYFDTDNVTSFTSGEACEIDTHEQVAFHSSKTLANGSGGTCKAIIAYRFVDPSSGQIAFQKAEQQSCGQTLGINDFSPLISTGDVTLTNIRLSISPNTDAYPLFFIKVSGYAGVREREKSYFDVQTAISPRLLDISQN
jgi:prepilin-type N-terminal cleavage/methylation domain-containing protein